ncbi:MAG: HTH domain-containing protein [Bacteroidales bacterium]|nr:HTH domain-containing protein [Bacteroidales bacterium]
MENRTIVVFEGNGNIVRNLQNVTDNVTDNVTERLPLMLSEIKANPNITTHELAKKINVARMTVYRDLEKLKKLGAIVRVGPDKGGYWEVKKDVL